MTSTPSSNHNSVLLGSQGVAQAIESLVVRIHDNHPNNDIILIGLLSRGNFIAQRIADQLSQLGHHVQSGDIDISLYRDDVGKGGAPTLRSSHIDFPINDALVVLVDDVIYTGRTIRAAINALMDYGRPTKIELAVLVDRGGREMPIQPNYAGFTSPIPGSKVSVLLTECDEVDSVILN